MAGGIEYDRGKFEELVVYLATRLGPEATLGRVKLMKLLMQADFTAYARLGRPITGATYEKWEYGHFAREWVIEEKNLTSNGAIIEQIVDYYGRNLRHIAPLRKPDLSRFTEQELEIIEEALARYGHLSATVLSELAHRQVGWRLTEYREEIPYNTVFLGTGDIGDEEIRRGHELASEHGWN